MWNIYHLIKSGALKPIVLESAWNRAIREIEEQRQQKLTEIIQSVQVSINEMELGLSMVKDVVNNNELFKIGNEIDMNSLKISGGLIAALCYGGKLVNGIYYRAVSLIQKSGEFFRQYPINCFDIFAESAKKRESSLTEIVTKYHPELIKSN